MASESSAAALAAASGSDPPTIDLGRAVQVRVTRYDPISIWDIDMGYRYGISDINGIPTEIFI